MPPADSQQAHTPLPSLHRIHGEFSLMNSDTKELFPVSHAAIDELCRRSNAYSRLLAQNKGLREALEKIADAYVGCNSSSQLGDELLPLIAQARLALDAQ